MICKVVARELSAEKWLGKAEEVCAGEREREEVVLLFGRGRGCIGSLAAPGKRGWGKQL